MGARNAFALSQIIILAVIACALYLYMRRGRSSGYGNHLSEADMARARERITELMKNDSPQTAAARGHRHSPLGSSAALTSALPSWTATTPPHVVLGVPSDAKAQVVDMAYRALVKKYHPDRFSSWGPEYMDRAHEIIIIIQKAKDTMMKTIA